MRSMERLTVEVKPLTEDGINRVEWHINFDWAALGKHRDRFHRQQEGEVVYLVAWYENLPVGHALLKWYGTTDDPRASKMDGCPDIEDLFVSPDYRSRGTGSCLLEQAESLVTQRGYCRIGLGVAIDNPRARSLYERSGYVDTGSGEYRTGGSYTDKDGQEKFWEEICRYLIKLLKNSKR